MKPVINICLLLLFFGFIFSQNCGPSDPSDKMQSGTQTLVRQNPGHPRLHNYNIPINDFQVTNVGFEVAVSTQSINGYNPFNGFDYKVNGGKKVTGNILVLAVHINEDAKWSAIKVSYLVSNWYDLIAGSFIGEPFRSSNSADFPNGRGTIQTYIPLYRLKDNYNYDVATFISGFRTEDNNFNLYLVSDEIDKTEGRVVVQYETNANRGFEILQITYIVYPINHQTFSFDGSTGTYQLAGPSSFQSTNINNGKLAICKKGGNQRCPNNQILVGRGCQCQPGTIKINEICYVSCGANAYFNNQNRCVCIPGYQLNVQRRCVQVSNCGPNEVDIGNGRCECRPGYFRDANLVCRQNCGQNQIFTGEECSCQNGFFRNSQGICQVRPNCPANSAFSEASGQCECNNGFVKDRFGRCIFNQQINCPGNQVAVNGRCECAPGFFRNSQGICQVRPSCPANSVFSEAAGQCECNNGFTRDRFGRCVVNQQINCKVNEVILNGKCDCVPGFFRHSNTFCYQIPNCGQGKVFNIQKGRCQCPEGFTENANGFCFQVPACPQNQQFKIQTSRCECIKGFLKAPNGFCFQAPNCDQNKEFSFRTGRCQCIQGFIQNANGACNKPLICRENQSFNSQTGKCQCIPGFIKLGPVCANICGINQKWVNDDCVCIQGTAWINGACRNCPSDSYPNTDKTSCICRDIRSIFNTNSLRCQQCSPNSYPNSARTECLCNQGYRKNANSGRCERIVNCPANSSPNQAGICICNNGFYMDQNICRPQPTCPSGAAWNQQDLKCICTNPNNHLINGACRSCPQNQRWNGDQCVCNPKFFKINGVCRTCDPRTTYNGVDCLCNIGFYGNRDLCQPCHSTCSRCSGGQANQCLACVDISYTLLNGFCSREQPCPIGSYFGTEGICETCMEYCRQCDSDIKCNICAPGFELMEEVYGNQIFNFCVPICGDGKKNGLEKCDDENRRNNDGCNSQCEVQDGWFCSGGSSLQRSTCTTKRPPQSQIQIKGAVNMAGRVLQSVRLSFIPPCFRANECADCYQILKVSVTQAAVPMQTLVNYIPNSGGQFLVEFKFPGIAITSAFTFNIRINNDLPSQYNGCFTQADLEQSVTTTVDPALLILAEEKVLEDGGFLTIEEITQSSDEIDYSPATLELINSIQ